MLRFFDFLRTSDLPLMARPNFVAELRHMLMWGVVVGTVEGNIASIVAAKTFHASELLTTLVWSIPILVNVLNVAWGVVLRGRPRVRSLIVLGVATSLTLVTVHWTSAAGEWAGWVFAAQIAVTHLFFSALVTLRTSIWNANYPASQRGRIAGRIQTARLLLSLLTAGALGLLFDWQAEFYVYVYPVVGMTGLLSLIWFGRVRVRGERGAIRRYGAIQATHSGGSRPLQTFVAGLREAAEILRSDRRYARYMNAQFLLGSANFFTDPILVTILTKQLHFGYFTSSLLMYQIPAVMSLVAIRFWGPYFDRVGVVHFRTRNSAVWIIDYACVLASAAFISSGSAALAGVGIAGLLLARILHGVAHGGGQIAWNLGHLHFARDREHQIELYMGIHVALTGLRGALMPLLGWAASGLLGWGAFTISLGFSIAAFVLFCRLARAEATAGDVSAAEAATEAARSYAT